MKYFIIAALAALTQAVQLQQGAIVAAQQQQQQQALAALLNAYGGNAAAALAAMQQQQQQQGITGMYGYAQVSLHSPFILIRSTKRQTLQTRRDRR